MSKETIIFLSAKDPFSSKSWSGIPYFMYNALSRYYHVEYIASPEFRQLKRIGYYLNRFLLAIGCKKYLMDYGIILSFLSGVRNTRILKRKKGIKFIFSPAGAFEIAFLRSRIPIVYCGDCSLLQLIDYYPALKNVSSLSKWEVRFIEHKAFYKASVNIFSSAWASDFVASNFLVKNVVTIPFGANLKNPPDVVRRKESRPDQCTIVFVGVDWVRKGGDIALQTREMLEQLGIDCRIVVIGSLPPATVCLSDKVQVIESLDKVSEEVRYSEIFKASCFMILPTVADCTPVVIAEAFAFGVPVAASDTGGIPSMVKEGVNGFLIKNGNPQMYASKIADALRHADLYEEMVLASFRSFQDTFNWDVWIESVLLIVKGKFSN